MPFYSISFLFFFGLFFFLYWFVFARTTTIQNIFLLVGSLTFYAFSSWQYLILLLVTTLFIYLIGQWLEKKIDTPGRKLYLGLGLFVALSPLFVAKYMGFFVGIFTSLTIQNILLPLGISFYTFRMLSYLLDIHNGKIEAQKSWLVFFNYVSFFPCIVSGPIDRAGLLFPQLTQGRQFDYYLATDGMRQFLWGLFKKTVVADNLASLVNATYDNYLDLPASSLLVSILLYSFQIYADFSGYSDMAIGLAKLLGFKVTRNFEYPFFAENIAEFWRRWHISLTSWTTEYLFTPLTIAFRDWNKVGLSLAILINFLIIGWWHGANWTFMVFGLLHAIYYLPLILKDSIGKRSKKDKRPYPSFTQLLKMAGVFLLVSVAFVFFRAQSLSMAFAYFSRLFSSALMHWPVLPISSSQLIMIVFSLLLMLVVEWVQRSREHGLYFFRDTMLAGSRPGLLLRWTIYVLLILLVFSFQGKEQDFIYFRF